MKEIDELEYFLNSMNETPPFKDDKYFKIKVQKLVYLSKFFGWDNSYHFNLHKDGPYCHELSRDLKTMSECPTIPKNWKLKTDSLKDFTKNQNVEMLEVTSIILYYLNKTDSQSFNGILDILSYLKPNFSKTLIVDSYRKIKEYRLINRDLLNDNTENLTKEIVLDKLNGLMGIFEKYDVCSNQMLFLGSLDYFRLALEREKLNPQQQNELLNVVFDYAEYVENYYFTKHMLPENFAYYDLTPIEEEFNQLQYYISDLGILPRLNDENVDLSIFLE